MSVQIALALAVFIAAYVLIATEKIPRVAVALGGAAAMVMIGATDDKSLFFSEDSGIDWNVIFLLLGMMIIVGIMRHTGVFEFVAIWATKKARGRPFRIMVMLVVITAVLSAFLDNVTTVLLIAPVTFLVCERLAVPPIPYLIAEVMASNIGGTATLIGDPPNIIIGSRSGLSFNDFLLNLTPLIAVLVLVFLVVSRIMFRKAFQYDPERAARVMELNPAEAIGDKRLLVKSLSVLVLVLAGFVLDPVLGLSPAIVAMMGAGLLIALTRLENRKVFGDVEWETLLFFAGLFTMVGSLVNLGIIDEIGRALSDLVGDNFFGASIGMLVGSAVVSGVVDNIPYVATMAPITANLVHSGGAAAHPLWWALALGADLGGNATAIGASANVVVVGIAKRNGHDISFWRFTKCGLIVTGITIAVCVPYIWLRYYL
ncbi:ArsB/NhaD family transporter [Spelaeicoccus albus]|uniref:Na+/H+ antiporter NhaD/arsenite permease-like protein n=1 Tax=Spelaeicoccus albus TaxID=1280376 RepID=A0A7Z0A7B3_9MICO|nr:ArsB/NhaD family transporter [Spelaeicoccus albus]NYI65732.1 Na+/H+ antiporter NhaD/arsenite permease-like protein [Spelaeicoccus albus]